MIALVMRLTGDDSRQRARAFFRIGELHYAFPDGGWQRSAAGRPRWSPSAPEEAGIDRYSWHCNRHTFASRLVMAGVICGPKPM